ncbi:MAG: GNAT family N-acetyltransferase [Actinobacteria bacterium]|nr:GNAT family N-acetyltransferase [Actinomycetota bacterium]
MADVSVRPARPADAERVARVQLSTWRIAYAGLLPPEALDVPEVQAAALWLGAVESPPTPRHRLLVAFEREELVGFAASGPASDDGLDPVATVELLTLLVEPRFGRRGHGARLVAASVEDWRRSGAETAVAWAWERDPATRSFLLSAGWEPDGADRGLDTGRRVERQLRFHTDVREEEP